MEFNELQNIYFELKQQLYDLECLEDKYTQLKYSTKFSILGENDHFKSKTKKIHDGFPILVRKFSFTIERFKDKFIKYLCLSFINDNIILPRNFPDVKQIPYIKDAEKYKEFSYENITAKNYEYNWNVYNIFGANDNKYPTNFTFFNDIKDCIKELVDCKEMKYIKYEKISNDYKHEMDKMIQTSFTIPFGFTTEYGYLANITKIFKIILTKIDITLKNLPKLFDHYIKINLINNLSYKKLSQFSTKGNDKDLNIYMNSTTCGIIPNEQNNENIIDPSKIVDYEYILSKDENGYYLIQTKYPYVFINNINDSKFFIMNPLQSFHFNLIHDGIKYYGDNEKKLFMYSELRSDQKLSDDISIFFKFINPELQTLFLKKDYYNFFIKYRDNIKKYEHITNKIPELNNIIGSVPQMNDIISFYLATKDEKIFETIKILCSYECVQTVCSLFIANLLPRYDLIKHLPKLAIDEANFENLIQIFNNMFTNNSHLLNNLEVFMDKFCKIINIDSIILGKNSNDNLKYINENLQNIRNLFINKELHGEAIIKYLISNNNVDLIRRKEDFSIQEQNEHNIIKKMLAMQLDKNICDFVVKLFSEIIFDLNLLIIKIKNCNLYNENILKINKIHTNDPKLYRGILIRIFVTIINNRSKEYNNDFINKFLDQHKTKYVN